MKNVSTLKSTSKDIQAEAHVRWTGNDTAHCSKHSIQSFGSARVFFLNAGATDQAMRQAGGCWDGLQDSSEPQVLHTWARGCHPALSFSLNPARQAHPSLDGRPTRGVQLTACSWATSFWEETEEQESMVNTATGRLRKHNANAKETLNFYLQL